MHSLIAAYRSALGLRPPENTAPPAAAKVHKSQRVKLPVVEGDPPKFSLQSMIDQYLAGVDEASVQHLVGTHLGGPRSAGVFHPSDLAKEGVCRRLLAYELYAAPREADGVDARLRRIFDNGHFVHARLQHYAAEALKQHGGTFYKEVKLDPDAKKVSGTMDGGLIFNRWPYGLEIKSMRKADYVTLGAHPWDDHFDQLNIYMRLSGLKAGFILVECKDNQDVREYFVRFDEARWRAKEAIVDEVLETVGRKELPAQITSEDGCDGKRCRFWRICKGPTKWSPP